MATTAVSIGEYLQDLSYNPDVEYIDGELRERSLVKSVHGLLQTLIGSWFQAHKLEWNVKAGAEIRTLVSPTRVRLPDVIVGPRKKWPEVLTEPPLIVIEILSPGDSYSDTRALARDYHAMGIENIWLIDPETRTSEMYRNGSWLEASRLEVQNSPIYLDMREIFATLDEDDGDDEGNR